MLLSIVYSTELKFFLDLFFRNKDKLVLREIDRQPKEKLIEYIKNATVFMDVQDDNKERYRYVKELFFIWCIGAILFLFITLYLSAFSPLFFSVFLILLLFFSFQEYAFILTTRYEKDFRTYKILINRNDLIQCKDYICKCVDAHPNDYIYRIMMVSVLTLSGELTSASAYLNTILPLEKRLKGEQEELISSIIYIIEILENPNSNAILLTGKKSKNELCIIAVALSEIMVGKYDPKTKLEIEQILMVPNMFVRSMGNLILYWFALENEENETTYRENALSMAPTQEMKECLERIMLKHN